MNTLTVSDRGLLVTAIERKGKTYTQGPRVILEIVLGRSAAARLAEVLGTHARPNGDKWRVRVRGTGAEALLTDLMPDFTDRTAAHVRRAIAKAEAARTASKEDAVA